MKSRSWSSSRELGCASLSTFLQNMIHAPVRLIKQVKTMLNFIINGKRMQEWMKITAESFSQRFKDPLLREAFKEMWVPEFSMFFYALYFRLPP